MTDPQTHKAQQPVQNTPTPAQKAMKQTAMTPAESGNADTDIVGPNDGPATTRENQPVRPDDAGAGTSGSQDSSPRQDGNRREKPERDGE